MNKKFQQEKEKIRKLESSERTSYIWDYYKLPIIGTIVLILLVIYFSYIFVTRPNAAAFYATFVNSFADVSEKSTFYQEFADYAGIDLKENELVLETGSYFDLNKASGYNSSYYEKTVAVVEAGTVDIVVCDYDNYYNLAGTGRFLSLKESQVSALFKKYKGRLLSTRYAETGEEAVVGIDVSDSSRFKQLSTYENGAVVLISSNAPHLELVERFIDFLLEENQ